MYKSLEVGICFIMQTHFNRSSFHELNTKKYVYCLILRFLIIYNSLIILVINLEMLVFLFRQYSLMKRASKTLSRIFFNVSDEMR